MRKFILAAILGLAVAAAPFTVQITRALAAYTQTIMNDGTTAWYWTSTSAVLTLNGTATSLLSVDGTAGLILPISTVAALPTCTTALKGAQRMVSDATTPTYNGALTGGSTVVTAVGCNGTAWLSH